MVNSIGMSGSSHDPVLGAITQLQRLSEVFQRRRRLLARAVGLTEQQWRVLEEISSEHFLPSMFARERESSAAAVSKVIRQLLDKGLITVSISDSDGRQRLYELSAEGKALMRRLRARRKRAIEAIWAPLPKEELHQFEEFSARLIEAHERYAEEED